MDRCLDAIGSEDETAGPTSDDLMMVRQALLQELNMDVKHTVAAKDTLLQASLIWRMAREMGDPDADTIFDWLTNGAPAGIAMDIEDPGGIFPPDEEGSLAGSNVDVPDHTHHTMTRTKLLDQKLQDWCRLASSKHSAATKSYRTGCAGLRTYRSWA